MRTHAIQRTSLCTLLATAALLAGCAAPVKTDYTAFRAAKPASILVLPPVNESTEVNATFSMLAQATYPLAEGGYYVMPVTLVNETFHQNGLTVATDMHEVPVTKLKEIFGADAALYMKITRYGSTYTILSSAAVVSAEARLVDLSTGTLLWSGRASASSDENNNNSGGGLAGLLVAAIVKQIMNNVTDASHPVAGVTSARLLSSGTPNGLLYGPRSPLYGKDNTN
ncbi:MULTISPECIES: DUF799 domain-containing protein [Aquabacterium]|jgi:hypothetical protein|uniref:DUF799 domain-containing protein n=1 Tax=Aquabacterium TaxID=92793 RepID=UPI000718BE88|nr:MULTISPECIES: DUF799 domain-containing protein [Aquabacterium]MBU0917597.1 DUF799 domain-containing protein [Gammaproteobacteria bacterium]